MITYTRGNAITLAMKGNYVAFAHGCNCLCRMGRGIAKEVKERLTPLWLADARTLPGNRKKLGTFTSAPFDWGIGYNLYTQFSHSDKDDMVDWEAVDHVIKAMFEDMLNKNILTLFLPKICSGLARGHLTEEKAWAKVVGILEMHKPALIEVVVVEYDPDAN